MTGDEIEPIDLKMAALAALGLGDIPVKTVVDQVETNGKCTFHRLVFPGAWPRLQITLAVCDGSIIAINSVDALQEVVQRCRLNTDDLDAFSRFFDTYLCPPSKYPHAAHWERAEDYVPHRRGESIVLYWYDHELDAYEEVTISSGGINTKAVA